MPGDFDAVVIGAGHNGLVAANMLAERGWSVLVVEAQDLPGGAVKSGEITEPGFTSDLFSAFYPLAAASPAIRALGLERQGLRWRRSELSVAHPQADGSCAGIAATIDETAAMLERFAPGDGDAWRSLYAYWERAGAPFIDALLSPFPPLRGGARLAAALGPRGLLRFGRFAVMPVRRLAEERFRGDGGAWLLAGNALHADLTPESAGGALFGWVLCGLGQQHGFPVPEGGAGRLTAALVDRLRGHGGQVECGRQVERVLVRGRRAVGVRTADGQEIAAGRAVLAGAGAPALFRDLVGEQHLPAGFVDDLRSFQYDNSTVKVDWSLDAPIPWIAEDARRAGTIHVADGMDHLTETTAQLSRGLIADRPFLVVGQYSMVDETRQPPGRETAWAYTHVPQRVKGDARGELTGSWDEREVELFVARIEAEIERRAPGFGALIRARHVFTPRRLEAANSNLVGGAVNSGTAQIHQQLVFRPVPGLGRAETPIRGLFLAGASAHPGGGVHGAAGANAAR
ncbi:MAG TPA: NAD(P)/FAD-dependent oxidoreductase, partial [Thermoleophilaceae bacterium]|nr:NAD(P)/FAD-dependent oxidoreductase [Thermoleophilaceae bacterium]